MKYTNGLTDKDGYKLISSNDLEGNYREEKMDINVDTLTYKELKPQTYLPDEFFKTNFDLIRTGKIYGTRIFKSKALCRYEQKDANTILGSDNSDGEYLKDSIGLRCQPYVKGIQEAIDDFTDTVPMFKKWRCNAFLDENGDIRIKHIQGQEGYKRSYKDGETAMDDCILKMSFYWKMEERDDSFDYFVSDIKHDDTWLPWGDCIRHDKSVAPYFALPAYISTLHKDEDGFQRLYSITNSYQQGNFSHDSQLPYYSQANSEDESLLDDNTYSYEVGRGAYNETPTKNNTYRGRGRHYGTRHNLTAYLALMQIIKYRTRNLHNSTKSIFYDIPQSFDGDGNPKGKTSISLKPWIGKIMLSQNENIACYLRLTRAVWYNDEAKDADGNYTIKKKRNVVKRLYIDIPKSYFGEDYDGTAAFVPICPNVTVQEGTDNNILDDNGYPTVKINSIDSNNSSIYSIGDTYIINCAYCNSKTDTEVTYLSNNGFVDYGTNDKSVVKRNAKISKIEKIKVDLPEMSTHYDSFEVTKWNGTKITIPEGELVLPADTYYFYKIYFEGVDSIQSLNRDVRYDNDDPTLIHPTLKGRVQINASMPYAGNTDMIPNLYDGTTVIVNGNDDIHSYIRRHYTNPERVSYEYVVNTLDRKHPYRLEGIEVLNGKYITSSNSFVRGVFTRDVDGNITDKHFEIYVAKKSAKRYKLLTNSGSFTSFYTNTIDRTEEIEKNYNRVNLDPTSLLFVNEFGNFINGDWGWIGDCKIYQDEEGNDILYPIMRANGMYYSGNYVYENNNWGDKILGQPDERNHSVHLFCFRQILLVGNAYENRTDYGVSFNSFLYAFNFSAWDFASRPW